MKKLVVILCVMFLLAGCVGNGDYVECDCIDIDHPLVGRWQLSDFESEPSDDNPEMRFFSDLSGYSSVHNERFSWSVEDNIDVGDDMAELGIGRLTLDFEDRNVTLYYRIDGERLFIAEHPRSGGWSYIRIGD